MLPQEIRSDLSLAENALAVFVAIQTFKCQTQIIESRIGLEREMRGQRLRRELGNLLFVHLGENRRYAFEDNFPDAFVSIRRCVLHDVLLVMIPDIHPAGKGTRWLLPASIELFSKESSEIVQRRKTHRFSAISCCVRLPHFNEDRP